MRLLVRVLLIGTLSLGLLGAGVHYDTNYGDHWPYPSSDDLATDYSAHVGEAVLLFGTVTATDDGIATVSVSHGDGTVSLRVENFDESVRSGGFVQVSGTLRPNRTVSATNVVVVNESSGSRLYKYAASLVGAGLVVALFLREWTVDTETLTFEVR